jgi:hypothetical protein
VTPLRSRSILYSAQPLASVVGVLAVSGLGAAQPLRAKQMPGGPQVIQLAIETVAGCPSKHTFVSQLRRLAPQVDVRLSSAATAERISLGVEGTGYAARYRDRSVYSQRCEDAAFAVAVVAAIAWDPLLDMRKTEVTPNDFAEPDEVAAAPERDRRGSGKSSSPNADTGGWLLQAGALGSWGELKTWWVGGSLGASYVSTHPVAGFQLALDAGQALRELPEARVVERRAALHIGWCPRLRQGTWFTSVCLGPELGVQQVHSENGIGFEAAKAHWGLYSAAHVGVLLVDGSGPGWGFRIWPQVTVPLTRDVFVVESPTGDTVRQLTHAWLSPGLRVELSYGP